jgi:hypothetical protein
LDAFVAKMQSMIDPERALTDVPKRQPRPVAKPLEHFATRYKDRDHAFAEAYGTGMYSMQAITEHFGVSRMTVSCAVKKNANRPIYQGGQCEVRPHTPQLGQAVELAVAALADQEQAGEEQLGVNAPLSITRSPSSADRSRMRRPPRTASRGGDGACR